MSEINGRIGRFLLLSGGVAPRALEQEGAPDEINKFKAFGFVVLLTSSLAFFSALFFFNELLSHYDGLASEISIILLSLLWAVLIYALNRVFLSTMFGETGKEKLVAGFVRIALAVVIGIIISDPLKIAVFDEELEAQIASNFGKTSSERERDKYSEIRTLEEAREQKQKLLAVSSERLTSLNQLQRELIEAREQGKNLQEIFSLEIAGARTFENESNKRWYATGDGVSKYHELSGKVGEFGPESQKLKSAIGEWSRKISELERERKNYPMEASSIEYEIATYKEDLELLRDRISGANDDARMVEEKVEQETAKGYVAKRRELQEYLDRHGGKNYFLAIGLTILLIFVESAPMAAKILSRPGPYERSVARRDGTFEGAESHSEFLKRRIQEENADHSAQRELALRELETEMELGMRVEVAALIDEEIQKVKELPPGKRSEAIQHLSSAIESLLNIQREMS
ncbi:DUF4407 domain-containing protein [Parahaliea mediterranea]|uniref:DUF4407 domain-containing protein n=1 Tax=Parahaliea mediterranea TaxID=651086 RepID=UPI001300630A|nr:DUF4407 domain-containing protein [Parahaliea mediterranea]